MVFLKAVLAFILSVLSAFNIFDGPREIPKNENSSIINRNFTALTYPMEAVKTLSALNLTEEEYTSKANATNEDVFVQAQGYTDANGIIISPDFNASIGGYPIPVYATTVFVGETQTGELHSFSEIYVKKDTVFPLSLQLSPNDVTISSAKVLPASLASDVSVTSGSLTTEINGYGTYTVVLNGDDQENVFTLFVREDVDEDAEIASLKEQYGENNVIVVEKGVLEMDYFSVTTSNTVIYLKRGAYVIANHKYDINSDAQEATYNENATSQNAIGLTRFPFLNFYGCQNIKVLGNGVFDMTRLDRRERRGIVFTSCQYITVSGIKIINAPEWSFITYDCENINIENTDIFGYRQNSDAYAICNSRNVTVNNCFARSGDDLFDVKTLGGGDHAISKDITFTNCIAWGGKARCFGICGEVNKKIENVTFKDCDVIFHDATWNADRIPAIAIIVEQGGGSISNVTFENINVYEAQSRAIGCLILTDSIGDFSISDVTYKNITYNAPLKDKISSNSQTTNLISVKYDNVVANGNKITDSTSSSYIEKDSYSTIAFN